VNEGPDTAASGVTSVGTSAEGSALDLDTVMAEIIAEAAQRRLDGTYPPDLERKLSETFARFSPPGALGTDLNALLDRAELAAAINADVPTAASRPYAAAVKKVVRKSTGFYQRYVTQQSAGFADITVRALRRLADRLDDVSAAAGATNPDAARLVDALAPTTDPAAVIAAVTAALARHCGTTGRTVHLGAGTGALVAAVNDSGRSAYGVDRRAVVAGRRRTAEIRVEEPASHVRRLAAQSLQAAVVTWWGDLSPTGHRISTLTHLARALGPDGVLVLVVDDVSRLDHVTTDVASVPHWPVASWCDVLDAAHWTTSERVAVDGTTAVVVVASPTR
jgi:hypothetical protein